MNESSSRPIGQLFTDIYRDKGVPVKDSERLRVQLYKLFCKQVDLSPQFAFSEYLKEVAGIDVAASKPYNNAHENVNEYVLKCPTDELLNWITYVARFLQSRHLASASAKWIESVKSAIAIQNAAYVIDNEGGMHHKYDQAFSNSKLLTLSCLSGSDFKAAHDEIEKAFDFLTQVQPDTKLAVVNAFLAAENLFKLTIKANNGLTSQETERQLKPVVQRLYSLSDPATQQASGKLVSSFGSWADACHPYRHGQQDPRVTAPPIEIALALVTAGADYIRWLAGLAERNR